MSRVDDEFDEIVREVSERAAAVKCSPSDYRQGLQQIIEQLQNDIQANEEMHDDEDE